MVEKIVRRSPEHHVYIEYSVTCSECDFAIEDCVQDANEQDALNNIKGISEMGHFTINRIKGKNCEGTLNYKTKTTYF